MKRTSAAVPADGVGATGVGPNWAGRLRGVGMLLDRERVPVRDVCILDVGDGFVVEALAAGHGEDDSSRPAWAPISREYGAAEVESVVQQGGPCGRGRR